MDDPSRYLPESERLVAGKYELEVQTLDFKDQAEYLAWIESLRAIPIMAQWKRTLIARHTPALPS